MIVRLGSQQLFALFPVCPSLGAASATLFPLSVEGLPAANSLTPVSPKSDKRSLKHAKRQRLKFGMGKTALLPPALQPEFSLTQTSFGHVVASNPVAHCFQGAACPEYSLVLTETKHSPCH